VSTYGAATYGSGSYGQPAVAGAAYGDALYGSGTYGDPTAGALVAATDTVRGSGRMAAQRNEQWDRALVEAKWAVIEAAQRADAQARMDQLQRDGGQAAPSAALSAAVGARGQVRAVSHPGIAVTRLAGASLAAGAPLLPPAAERARAARQRDDDEALLLLLADL